MSPQPVALARFAILRQGFPPFFLGGAAWAATAMILWLGELAGLWQFAESYGSALLRLSAPLFAGATTAVLFARRVQLDRRLRYFRRGLRRDAGAVTATLVRTVKSDRRFLFAGKPCCYQDLMVIAGYSPSGGRIESMP